MLSRFFDKIKEKHREKVEEASKKRELENEIFEYIMIAERIWGDMSKLERDEVCEEVKIYKILTWSYENRYHISLIITGALLVCTIGFGLAGWSLTAFLLSLVGFIIVNGVYKRYLYGIKYFLDPISASVGKSFTENILKDAKISVDELLSRLAEENDIDG